MFASRRHRWRARSLCHFLLARGIRRQTAVGDIQYPPRRTGLLRRADRRVACWRPLRPVQKTAALENRRHPRAQHCTGSRLWPHRMPDERLLLWPAVRFAVGDSFSKRPRDARHWRAPDRNLRGSAGFLPLPFPRSALSPEEIRRPDFCAVPALLRCAPGVRRIVSRRLHNLLPERTRHAGASVEHLYFCGRRVTLGGVVRSKTKSSTPLKPRFECPCAPKPSLSSKRRCHTSDSTPSCARSSPPSRVARFNASSSKGTFAWLANRSKPHTLHAPERKSKFTGPTPSPRLRSRRRCRSMSCSRTMICSC